MLGTLEKKGARRKNWQHRHFEFDPATRHLAYYAAAPVSAELKGEGTVSGVDDVPDRPGKRQHRFNIQLAHHVQRNRPGPVEVAAESPAEKSRWMAGLQQQDAYGRKYVSTPYTPQNGRLSTEDELCRQVEAALGQPVHPERMKRVLPAFTRAGGGGKNIDGEGFMNYGLDNYVSNTLSRQFCEGQAVMVEFEEKPNEKPVLGVVRSVTPGTDGDLHTVEAMGMGSDGGFVVHAGVPAARLIVATGRALDAANPTQLSAFMESVGERVGPDPGGEHWKAEVVMVIKEDWVLGGELASMDDPNYEDWLDGEDGDGDANSYGRSFEAFCQDEDYKKSIDYRMSRNGSLSLEDAQLLTVIGLYGGTLAVATREARTDYAGLTHRYFNLLVRLADGAPPAPDCYYNLQDTTSTSGNLCLQASEPGLGAMVKGAVAAARAGCRGRLSAMHSATAAGATLVAPVQPKILAPEGYRQSNHLRGGVMEVQDSVVVKFVSAGRDGAGLHTAVFTDSANAAFPPMTLFAAIDVQLDSFEFDGTDALLRVCKGRSEFGGHAPTPTPDASGRLHVGRAQLIEWMVGLNLGPLQFTTFLSEGHPRHQEGIDMFHKDFLPPGVDSSIYTVNRTLVTVQATYLLPAAAAAAASGGGGGGTAALTAATAGGSDDGLGTADAAHAKLMADSTKLGYGDRMTYVRGVAEIVFARPLTMAEEWARDHQWTDWTGGSFSGRVEFDYVWSEPAVEGRGGMPNFDKGHGGMRLADFRQLFVDQVAAAGGGDELVPTLEEVAAARLYTGPAYVKLNGFMRLVGTVAERHWRARLAQVKEFTYSSTVLHLIDCIRKFTQIAALQRRRAEQQGGEGEPAAATLYRGVRGVLPASFFEPDVQGFITAVDFGFTSTSTDRAVPIGFMAPGEYNVLWVMHCTSGADSAGQLHDGAVLQTLSQFPAEAETLLPPLCMLQALREGEEGGGGAFRMEVKEGTNSKGETVRYTEIHVRPCFV
jgi:hypothetical protein